ncbi:MAG: zinc/manganese transport system ATP-binding protein [Actinomycetota bacterium]|nr:zinc/manganese transport system ATP-binding protein [Actinomycetota bacterium]
MSNPAVDLHRASAGYEDRILWASLDLQISPGEFVAVLGANGTGKTTLLKVLLGLRRVSAGTVRVLGASPHRGDRRIGYVPQQRSFDPGLVLRGVDMVHLGLSGHRWGIGRRSLVDRARVERALDHLGATEYSGASIGSLSGGQQQRLRVAQALVSEPELLLADEPLLSLDPSSQKDVVGAIDSHRHSTGAAVVMVTHDINPIQSSVDRILYLAAGRWASGTPDQVLASDTLSELYGTQVDVVTVRDRVVIVGAPASTEHSSDFGHVHEIESHAVQQG